MRRSLLLLAAGLAAVVPAGAASAAPPSTWFCAGTASTAVFCVDPIGGVLYTDCVYLGSGPCTPVSVPGPLLACGGPLIDPILYCQ